MEQQFKIQGVIPCHTGYVALKCMEQQFKIQGVIPGIYHDFIFPRQSADGESQICRI